MNTTRIAVTSLLVCGLVTAAQAQREDAARSTQQQQTQGLRQVGRLIIPITGTLTTPGSPTTPTDPTTPPQQPTTPTDPTPPQTPPAPSGETPTTPTPTALVNEAADVASQVTGSFSIRRFVQTTTGEVAAVGMLTLSLTDATAATSRTVVTPATLPVAQAADQPSESAQNCETLSLALGPVDLDLAGTAVRLDEANVDFISRSAGRLGIVLCGANGVIDRGITPAERMRVLNTLLESIG